MSKNKSPLISRNDLVAGAILILIGIFYLLGQMFNLNLAKFTWPFFIIVPGTLVFVLALTVETETGKGLAKIGSIITMIGLLLLYQNTFDHFSSWAYAWALVVPTSLGLGQIIYGSLKGLGDYVDTGKRSATRGIIIFVVGAVFFELIIGISGFGLSRIGRYAWPVLLIGLGLFVLLRGRFSNLLPKAAQPVSNNSVEKLSQLKEMLDSGGITEDEYEEKKVEILSKM